MYYMYLAYAALTLYRRTNLAFRTQFGRRFHRIVDQNTPGSSRKVSSTNAAHMLCIC